MILGRGQQQGPLAVDQRENRNLLAVHVLLDHDLFAGRAELAAGHGVLQRRLGLRQGHGDRDALTGGEAIGLDHDWRAPVADIGLGVLQLREARVASGRDSILGAKVFHVALRALQLGRRRRGTENTDALGRQPVGEAKAERILRADHDQVDRLLFGESAQPLQVRCGDVQAFGFARDPRVPGRAVKLGRHGRGRDGPAQRVFPAARSDHQDSHI